MSTFQRTAALLTLSIGALASLPALADDIHYNQISLRAEASQEVPRDLMIVWLSADCDTPSLAAALVKLRARATARKASRSLAFSLSISESLS